LRQQKCVRQLEILSILRNLQTQIINRLEAMALTYSIEDDIRFQQGEEKRGIQKGIGQGMEKGMEKATEEAVKNLLLANIAPKQVAEYLKVSLELVQKVAKSIKK